MVLMILLIGVLGLATGLLLPWWTVVPVAVLVGWWRAPNGWQAFVAGLLGVALLRLVTAGYIHYRNEAILTTRIAAMAGIDPPWLLLAITALIGGLIGGFAAATGFQLRRAMGRLAENRG